ncbi:hypothetical protein ACN28C_19575 [Plantactinospora sp. WMMC1484]|uniref:hypothetical protein n=1 Tax=Plantactinospora sp. WMMC1484 TaxID=3404122 RepID=UPI003BF5B81A
MSIDSGITLPFTLFEPGRYAVQSNHALADKVQSALKKGKGVAADVRPVDELCGLRTRDDVPPLDLLLALGRLTSALPGLHRIGVGGLPGLSALRTASRWAIIRYLWAFSDHRPDLRLSGLTDEVRFHQRTLLSESFGIALTADLIERYILPGSTRVVDADAVNYDPVLAIDMAGLASHKPDYFWYRESENRLSEVVVVEVKGTTSGTGRCIEQIARGVEQVLVPARIHGVKMRRIVIGTELRDRRLRAYAVEVAEPEEDVRRHAYEVVRSRERYRPIEAVNLQTERFAAEADEADVTEESYYLDQVRLHAFAGLPFTGGSNSDELIRSVLSQREAVGADDLTFRVETTRMAAGDRVITIRTGVAEEFLSSSDAYRSEGSTERRVAYRRRHSGRSQRPIRSESVEIGRDLAVVTAADGCMLAVSFEDR